MSLSICTSCLSRLRLTSTPLRAASAFTITSTSSFHNSAAQYANPPKKKGPVLANQAKHRTSRSARIKRKRRDRPRPRQVGELRAQRQRIVLSNANALEIPGMEDLSLQNMSDSSRVGQVLGLEGNLLDQLRDAKVFKTSQNWNLFRKPATLIREETVSIGNDIKNVNDSQSADSKALRQIISGDRFSGKSLLLLQAMAMAYINKWIVINIPEAQAFTINRSSYAPLMQEKESEEQLYTQPQLTSDLLSRLAYSNENILKSLKPNHTLPESLHLKKNSTLKDIAVAGAENQNISWTVWQHLWKELTVPSSDLSSTNPRPPVLVAIDSLDHWMGPTLYRSADYKFIHAHQFTLIKQFISLLFGSNKSTLPNGGMVLAATTGSNNPTFPSFAVLLRQLSALASGTSMTSADFPLPGPYSKHDPHVLNLLSNSNSKADATTVRTLKGLSKIEAKGLLEYFARSGVLKETITETVVGEKWTLSSGGIVGELMKLGKRDGAVMDEDVRGTSMGMWPGQGLHRPVQ